MASLTLALMRPAANLRSKPAEPYSAGYTMSLNNAKRPFFGARGAADRLQLCAKCFQFGRLEKRDLPVGHVVHPLASNRSSTLLSTGVAVSIGDDPLPPDVSPQWRNAFVQALARSSWCQYKYRGVRRVRLTLAGLSVSLLQVELRFGGRP
jgi:hypothetical protein